MPNLFKILFGSSHSTPVGIEVRRYQGTGPDDPWYRGMEAYEVIRELRNIESIIGLGDQFNADTLARKIEPRLKLRGKTPAVAGAIQTLLGLTVGDNTELTKQKWQELVDKKAKEMDEELKKEVVEEEDEEEGADE